MFNSYQQSNKKKNNYELNDNQTNWGDKASKA
jgi:hypothetical protein